MARRAGSPPEKVSFLDLLRVVTGVLSLLFGVVILARTLPAGVYLPALVSGLSFIGFGASRLWSAWSGWRHYCAIKEVKRP
jgi:uncharacterized membrane protein HdeD (DUF308 family)